MGVGWAGWEGSDLPGLQGLEEFGLCPKDTGEPRKAFQLRRDCLSFIEKDHSGQVGESSREVWCGGRCPHLSGGHQSCVSKEPNTGSKGANAGWAQGRDSCTLTPSSSVSPLAPDGVGVGA